MPLPPYHGSWLQLLRSGSHRPLVPVCLHTPAVPPPNTHCRPAPAPSRDHAVWFYFLNPRITHICSSESLRSLLSLLFLLLKSLVLLLSLSMKKNVSSLVQSGEAWGRDTECLRKRTGCLTLSELVSTFVSCTCRNTLLEEPGHRGPAWSLGGSVPSFCPFVCIYSAQQGL